MAARANTRTPVLRSPAQIPLRPLGALSESEDLRTTRIPLVNGSPRVPGGFAPKAFVGEVVPFGTRLVRRSMAALTAPLQATAATTASVVGSGNGLPQHGVNHAAH